MRCWLTRSKSHPEDGSLRCRSFWVLGMRLLPIEKQWRFKEHIQWAADHSQLDEVGAYLRALSEQQWFHFGEL